MTLLDQLPFELISSILEHVNKKTLYRCVLTNKRLYNAAMPILWHHLEITKEEKFTALIITMSTSPRSLGEHVRSVAIRFFFKDDDVLTLLPRVPQLTHLVLEHASRLTDPCVEQIVRLCPLLSSLEIHKIYKLTLRSMIALGTSTNLTNIDLDIWVNRIDASMFAALQHCPLTSLSIYFGCLVPLQEVAFPANAGVAIATHFPHLTTLELRECDDDFTSVLTAAIAHAGVSVWPRLEHLSIIRCETLVDDVAIRFLEAHPHLRYLDLSYSAQLTDRTLHVMATSLPNLKEVRLLECPQLSASGLYGLAKSCKYLEQVKFVGSGIHAYDDDFPVDLDKDEYQTHRDQYGDAGSEDEWDYDEVLWFKGKAYQNEERSSEDEEEDGD